MDVTWFDDVGDDEDNDNEGGYDWSAGKDALIFLIDGTSTMYANNPHDDASHFHISTKVGCRKITLLSRQCKAGKKVFQDLNFIVQAMRA